MDMSAMLSKMVDGGPKKGTPTKKALPWNKLIAPTKGKAKPSAKKKSYETKP